MSLVTAPPDCQTPRILVEWNVMIRIASKYVLGLAVLLGVVVDVTRADEVPAKYALLVGINQYHSRELKTLQFAVNDARDLAAVLRTSGWTVTLLTEETGDKDAQMKPTSANVLEHLRGLSRRARKQDLVLFAFSGHGVTQAGSDDAFLCPVDAELSHKSPTSLVSVSQILSELEKSFAACKIMLCDASRTTLDPSRGVDGREKRLIIPGNCCVLWSCAPGEHSFEHDTLRHGLFFHGVLTGLQGEAADRQGVVDLFQLGSFVQKDVARNSHTLFPERRQSVHFQANLAGEPAVLVRNRPRPVVPSRR